MPRDREVADELSWWKQIRPDPEDGDPFFDDLPPFERFDVERHIAALFRRPLFGESESRLGPGSRAPQATHGVVVHDPPAPGSNESLRGSLPPNAAPPARAHSWKLPPSMTGAMDRAPVPLARAADADRLDTSAANAEPPNVAAIAQFPSALDNPRAPSGTRFGLADALRRGIETLASRLVADPVLFDKAVQGAAGLLGQSRRPASPARDHDVERAELRHRLAQLDDDGIERALESDEHALADPAGARAIADEIRRIRREDPARVGEATIARRLEQMKRDGRIATLEQESAARYQLRLEAQARRGIPDERRRLLTNDERAQLAAEYLRVEARSGKDAADAWLKDEIARAGSNAGRLFEELTAPTAIRPEAFGANRADEQQGEDGGLRVEPAQHKNDATPAPTLPSDIVRRSPQSEDERAQRDEAVRKEARERIKDRPRDDWKSRHDVIVEIARREGFVPKLARTHLWGQFRSTRPSVSTEEKLNAARSIAELARLFPDEIGRHFNKGELAYINEVVRLEREGTPRDRILDQAAANARYFDLGATVGLIAGARAGRRGRSVRENYRVGRSAEVQATEIIMRDVERMKLSPQAKRLVRIVGDGGTIPDLPLGTNHDQIDLYVEIKKLGARHREPQRRRLRAIGAHFVEIDPANGEMRAMIPPYERWITYEDWLREVERTLARKGRRRRR